MNADDLDDFDRALGALKADAPPPASECVRAGALAAFDRVHPKPRAVVRRVTWIGLAAAAVVFVAFRLGDHDAPESAPDASPAAVAQAPRALWLELDALARKIEQLPPPAAPAAPVYDKPEADPAFARLVVARAYERIDLGRARERYRELATEAPGSAVCDAAVARLEQLGR